MDNQGFCEVHIEDFVQCENCEKWACPDCGEYKQDSEGVDLCPDCYQAMVEDYENHPELYEEI